MVYDFIAAIALVLVIEGIMPFLAPRAWRLMLCLIASRSDRGLRVVGLILMLLGVMILFIMHRYF